MVRTKYAKVIHILTKVMMEICFPLIKESLSFSNTSIIVCPVLGNIWIHQCHLNHFSQGRNNSPINISFEVIPLLSFEIIQITFCFLPFFVENQQTFARVKTIFSNKLCRYLLAFPDVQSNFLPLARTLIILFNTKYVKRQQNHP